MLPKIGLTIGDVNGIGPEIIIKTFCDSRMLQVCTPIIYGSASVLNYYKKELDEKSFIFHPISDIKSIDNRKLNLVSVLDENTRIEPGVPSLEAGRQALISLQRASEDLLEGKLDAIVTAPIDKHTIQSEDFKFPGQTEYFSSISGGKISLMLLICNEMKIGTITGHLPLHEVKFALTTSLIVDKAKVLNESIIKDFLISIPKIAILALNPHAGDNGLLGNEEKEIIIPAIEKLKNSGIFAFGPFPADGFFGSKHYKNFDAVLCMYHDQALIPFKMLGFEDGVNYTAGLSFVRTSPDHGTAYDIAGKNLANESSYRNAIYKACDILKNRRITQEINEKPLVMRVVKQKEL